MVRIGLTKSCHVLRPALPFLQGALWDGCLWDSQLNGSKPDFSDDFIFSTANSITVRKLECSLTLCCLLASLQWPEGSLHLPVWRLQAVHERGNAVPIEFLPGLCPSKCWPDNIDQKVNESRLIWERSDQWMFPNTAIGSCLTCGCEPWPHPK